MGSSTGVRDTQAFGRVKQTSNHFLLHLLWGGTKGPELVEARSESLLTEEAMGRRDLSSCPRLSKGGKQTDFAEDPGNTTNEFRI